MSQHQGLQSLTRTDTYRGSGRTYRNAIAFLFASNPDKHLANVFLESDFCISCFFEVGLPCVSQHHACITAGVSQLGTHALRSLVRFHQPSLQVSACDTVDLPDRAFTKLALSATTDQHPGRAAFIAGIMHHA